MTKRWPAASSRGARTLEQMKKPLVFVCSASQMNATTRPAPRLWSSFFFSSVRAKRTMSPTW